MLHFPCAPDPQAALVIHAVNSGDAATVRRIYIANGRGGQLERFAWGYVMFYPLLIIMLIIIVLCLDTMYHGTQVLVLCLPAQRHPG